jgi:hypothetical protein
MRRTLIALTAFLSLVLAAPAGAVIVPQKGMIGLRLQMTAKAVRAAKGAPDRARRINHPIMGRVAQYRYGRTTVLFDGRRARARVVSLTTRDVDERTARGIGVGSSRAAVRARVAGVTCRTEFGVSHCYVGRFEAGRRVTDFRLTRNARVASVTVGIVID